MGVHTDDRFELSALRLHVAKLFFRYTILNTLGIPCFQPPKQFVRIDGDYLFAILYLNSHILNGLWKNNVKTASAVFLGTTRFDEIGSMSIAVPLIIKSKKLIRIICEGFNCFLLK